MRKSTLIGCFVGLLALTMNAQVTQPATSPSNTKGEKVEMQKSPTASLPELLDRYQNLGKKSGSISEYFSLEEQQMLRAYFSGKKPIGPVNSTNNSGIQAPMDVKSLGENNPVFYNGRSSAEPIEQIENLSPQIYGQEITNSSALSDPNMENWNAANQRNYALPFSLDVQEEILADEQYRANLPANYVPTVTPANRAPMVDWIPTAGATETFTPAVGDHFFDPGGPGGGSTGGTPGNYPNCNCDTQTTLAGVSEIKFLAFEVFATFDYLRIYDGTDATGTLLYDNGSGGPNSGDVDLTDMIASHGSDTFTATSGNFFFFFHASSVVDKEGWDVEIMSTGGGGGSFPDPYCEVTFPSDVEPITRVVFGGIDNSSDPTVNGSPAHEDFTAISTDIAQGSSNSFTVEGNTNGPFTTYITVYIDWDQSGTLEESERTDIGTIINSTGTDGIQAISNIVTPADATLGETRMRVLKKWGGFVTDPCNSSGFGQAEDYTINVTEGGPPPPAASTVYALNLRASCGTDFGTFDVGGPYNIDPISSITTSIFAGDFDGNDVLYALDSDAETLITIDTTTGVETTVGPLTNLVSGDTVTGLSWNESNGTMYASSNGTGNNIYTVDLTTGALTLIGDAGISGIGIWLAIDNSGNAFMANISDDSLYSIDLSTGAGTLIGPLGIDINFAQDADFDPDTGTLYMAAYIGGGVNQFCSVDIATGSVTQLGSINSDCAEVGLVAIKGTGGGGGGPSPCAATGPSNGFENGKSFTKNLGRIVAHDITIADGEDMLLESITIPAFIGTVGSGVNADNVDVMIYADNGSGAPGALITSEIALVPASQTVIGNNFGFDIWEVVLDITDVMLPGQSGSTTTYWIGLSLEPTDGSNTFWENSTAGLIGFGEAYDDGVLGFVIDNSLEGVYTFEGTCSPISGGGGVLETAYGINNGNFELIGFPVDDPATTEVFGDSPVTVNFENAGAIDPANPTTGYALDNGGQFYSFDVTTGFYTLLGNIPGDWVGMEFDQTSGILYAIQGADLYTIDPVAVTATLVGATGIPPSDLPIALAIDGNGVGYTYELVNQMFYSIDLATATATAIGDIGFDANFGQGMCWDPTTDTVYMAAFNNTTFAAEWRSVDLSDGSTSLIGPIVTTAATTQVAWVSIGETLPPPSCLEPTNLVVSNITATTADLSWDEEPNASNGYIWYVFEQGANPTTDTPVSTGTTPAGTTTATATGLAGGFSYDFYVVSDCGVLDGLSVHAGPVTFATPPACGGKFYDEGGPAGDYLNSSNVTTVITPDNPGDVVTVTFLSFNVESNWDALYVYDGPDATYPIISSGNPPTNSGFPAGGYYGTNIIGPFTSTDASGALTFVFRSDGSVTRPGWEADVTCALSPPPNDLIANSIDVDEIGFPYTDPGVHMPAATLEAGNPDGCDLTGANGVWYNFVPAADGTANATIVTPAGASSVTFYTAPDENAVETDLVLVPQQTNQCVPGTSASIYTLGGQAYYVFVLNTDAITDIIIDGTNLIGIDENTIEGFSYYPNPTNGMLNLQSVDNIEEVSVYNILGQLVINTQVEATTSQLDMSALETGTYLMKVTVNGETGTYRVLKN